MSRRRVARERWWRRGSTVSRGAARGERCIGARAWLTAFRNKYFWNSSRTSRLSGPARLDREPRPRSKGPLACRGPRGWAKAQYGTARFRNIFWRSVLLLLSHCLTANDSFLFLYISESTSRYGTFVYVILGRGGGNTADRGSFSYTKLQP